MAATGRSYLQRIRAWAFRCVCLLAVTLTVWAGAGIPSAQADSVGVGSEKAADIMRDRAASELDRMAGEGTSDQLEGAVQGSVGKATDNTVDQAKGKVKRDIGRLKGAAADAEDSLEDAAKGAANAVKDLLD